MQEHVLLHTMLVHDVPTEVVCFRCNVMVGATVALIEWCHEALQLLLRARSFCHACSAADRTAVAVAWHGIALLQLPFRSL